MFGNESGFFGRETSHPDIQPDNGTPPETC